MKFAAKRPARVVSVCALLGTGLIAPSVAAAPVGLTVSGPGHAQYYAVVTLHGSTAVPDQNVALYLRRAGQAGYARSRDITSDSTGHFSTATSTAFYGATDLGVARWDLTSAPADGRVEPTILTGWEHNRASVIALGPRGDLVTGSNSARQHIRTSGGAYRSMPAELQPYQSGEAIDERGTTAYTAPDGLPHFLRCH